MAQCPKFPSNNINEWSGRLGPNSMEASDLNKFELIFFSISFREFQFFRV